MRRGSGPGYLLVIGAAAAWSTSGLCVRGTADSGGFSPLSLTFWRDLGTAVSLIAGLAILRPDWLRVQRRDLPWLIALGVIGVGVFQAAWNLALLKLDIAIATVLLYSSPVFVSIIAWLVWREPLTRAKSLAIIMTLAGCVLAAGMERISGLDLTAGGLLLGLSAAITYGSFSLFSRHLSGRYSPWTILTYGFAIGSLVLLPFQFAVPQPAWPLPSQTWLWYAALIYVSTLAPYGAYVNGLRWLPVSIASILAASEVAFAALVGYLAFGEVLHGWQPVGVALVVGGVLLLTLSNLRGTETANRSAP